MNRITKTLRIFGLSCFCAFLICALVTASIGILMIWRSDEGNLDGVLRLAFMSAFFLTVLTGLLVSGTRSMIGIVSDGRDG